MRNVGLMNMVDLLNLLYLLYMLDLRDVLNLHHAHDQLGIVRDHGSDQIMDHILVLGMRRRPDDLLNYRSRDLLGSAGCGYTRVHSCLLDAAVTAMLLLLMLLLLLLLLMMLLLQLMVVADVVTGVVVVIASDDLGNVATAGDDLLSIWNCVFDDLLLVHSVASIDMDGIAKLHMKENN